MISAESYRIKHKAGPALVFVLFCSPQNLCEPITGLLFAASRCTDDAMKTMLQRHDTTLQAVLSDNAMCHTLPSHATCKHMKWPL